MSGLFLSAYLRTFWLDGDSELCSQCAVAHADVARDFETGMRSHPTIRRDCPSARGLRNLAFAFGLQDVRQQGEFLDQLLESVDGFLLLDLHNLYCQMHNFQLSATEILNLYPLARVRELHLSGGSWSHHGTATIRRDTHDQAVPELVFELLKLALQRCSSVEAIILERMGNTLNSEQEQIQFRQDFTHIRQITDRFTIEART